MTRIGGGGISVLSLFDGISSGMVALERAGIKVDRYVAYEIEPNAIKISQKNYPEIGHCGDVTVADFTQYEGFDLLLGGFPCQSLSITRSKTREKLDGKSKLFFECVRAMKEMKPKWFLFENVASMDKESEEIISGYIGCKPVVIDSQDFSAQERHRVYWTNIPVDMNFPRCDLVLKDIMEQNVPEKYFYKQDFTMLDPDKRVCASLHINCHDMHKRIVSPNYKCYTLTAVCGGYQHKKVMDNGRPRRLTPVEYERLQTLPDGYTAGVSEGARYKALGNGWTVDVIAHILKGINAK